MCLHINISLIPLYLSLQRSSPHGSLPGSLRLPMLSDTPFSRNSILDIPEFQLLQSYLFVYDKLEKANYYLELSIENANLPLDDCLINHLASNPVNDCDQPSGLIWSRSTAYFP